MILVGILDELDQVGFDLVQHLLTPNTFMIHLHRHETLLELRAADAHQTPRRRDSSGPFRRGRKRRR